jgi:hypothetical protein
MHMQLYRVIRIRVLSGLDTWPNLVSCVNVGLLNARAFLGYISENFPYLFSGISSAVFVSIGGATRRGEQLGGASADASLWLFF